MLPELMDHRQHGNPGKGAQAPILRHGARAAVLRRQHREGETERDRPPEQVLPCITGGCATNANDAEAEEFLQPLRLRRQEAYGHDYYFIATFMEDHLRFHAQALAAAADS